jgi:hypothetical protein
LEWQIEYADSAIKELSKLDKGTVRKALKYFDKKISVRSATPPKALRHFC